MGELIKYLKDPRFYVPVLFLVGFEAFMQTGIYRKILEPDSYAYNVNRAVRIMRESKVRPDILILGTSVAYQGVQIKTLNEKWLSKAGLAAQNAASEGAKLGTQHLIYKAVKKDLPRAKVVLHVSEVTFPWTARRSMDQPNRSMAAQFPRGMVFDHLKAYDAELSPGDYSFFWVRSLTYQKDLRKFILDPPWRFKKIKRRERKFHPDYVHINSSLYGMDAYPAKDLRDCVEVARKAAGRIPRDKNGKRMSDEHHRNAVETTCRIGLSDPRDEPGSDQWVRLYFKRLKVFYDEIHRDGRRVIVLFPPYSDLVRDLNHDSRVAFWKKHLARICGPNRCPVMDMRRVLDGPENASYYYDTIHLNRKGAEKFTDILAPRLLREPAVRALLKNKSAQ